MRKSYILMVLKEIAVQYYPEPHAGLPRKIFYERSVNKWACNEILHELKESNRPAIETLENFVTKVTCYANDPYDDHRHIFLACADVAKTMINILECMEGR